MALSENLATLEAFAGASLATALSLSDGRSEGTVQLWQQLTEVIADGARVCLSLRQAEQTLADASLALHTASVASWEGAGSGKGADAALNTAGELQPTVNSHTACSQPAADPGQQGEEAEVG